MFDMSIWELLVVLFIALMVLGPKQIPQIAFKIGQWTSYAKNAWYALSAELRQQMQVDIETQNNDEEKPTCNNRQK